jgi:hypothetical protein
VQNGATKVLSILSYAISFQNVRHGKNADRASGLNLMHHTGNYKKQAQHVAPGGAELVGFLFQFWPYLPWRLIV